MDVLTHAIGLRLLILFAALFVTGSSNSDCYAQQRTWTDVSGTYKIDAELTEVTETDNGLQAMLLKSDGKRMLSLIHI